MLLEKLHSKTRAVTPSKSSGGFSLVEVLISMTLLLIGFLSVIGTYPSMLDLNMSSWGSVQAATLLQQKLEDIASTETFISTTTSHDNPSLLSGCTRSWTGSADPSGNPNLQFVTVTVQWRGKQGLQSISASTYLTR